MRRLCERHMTPRCLVQLPVAFSPELVIVCTNEDTERGWNMMRRILLSTILVTAAGICAAVPVAGAQDARFYTPNAKRIKIDGDGSRQCKIDKKEQKTSFFGISTNGKVTDSKRSEYAMTVAKGALNAGYNYAILEPLFLSEYANYRDVVKYGWGEARKVTKKGRVQWMYVQNCIAIDDELAVDILYNPKNNTKLTANASLVDLRQFVNVIGSAGDKAGLRPPVPAINERRYKFPGDRERLARQHPVKMAALQCRSDLAPTSLYNFRSPPVENRACLEGLRAQAQAVGWTEFPLFVEEKSGALSSSGYSIRGVPGGGNVQQADIGADPVMDAALWGEGWSDLNGRFTTMPGRVMRNGSLIVLASDTLSGTDLIDYGVLVGAQARMRQRYSALSLKDETDGFQRRYEASRAEALKLQQRAADKNLNTVGASPRDIERLEEKIREKDAQITELRATPLEVVDFSEMEAMMKAFPSADVNMDEIKAQAQAAQAAGKARKLKSLEGRLAKYRAELAEKREASGKISAAGPSSNSGNSLPLHGVSAKASNRDRAVYRAIETYKYVYVLKLNGGTRCWDDDLICADKMQAYAALGPRLMGANYESFALPPGYEPYEP